MNLPKFTLDGGKTVASPMNPAQYSIMATRKPNLLVIQADQLAPQFLAAYGHPLVKTPNIDLLAEQGVVFLCSLHQCSALRSFPFCDDEWTPTKQNRGV